MRFPRRLAKEDLENVAKIEAISLRCLMKIKPKGHAGNLVQAIRLDGIWEQSSFRPLALDRGLPKEEEARDSRRPL